MKNAKKLLIFLTCLTASLFMAVSCGTGDNSSDSSAPAGSSDSVSSGTENSGSSVTSDGDSSSSEALGYTVVFEGNGGSDTQAQTLRPGEKATEPAEPVRDYYTFDCWCSDAALENEYDFASAVNADITLYARWIPQSSVRIYFETEGGTSVTTAVVAVGGSVSEPAAPQKTGYVFGGWYTDAAYATAFDFSAPAPDKDVTLYAKWNADENYRYVTYVLNGETVAVLPVEKGGAAQPWEGGLSGVTWYTDPDFTAGYQFGAPVESDITLYAVGLTDGLQIENGAVVGYTGTAEEVVIPAVYAGKTVTSVADGAFRGNRSITSVRLPDTVTSVGAYAFYGCEYLETINLTAGVTSVGAYAFYRCERLETFGDLGGVSEIKEGTFLGCKKISSVTLPDGVTSVGNYAFSECAALAQLSLPDTVASIGDYAFGGCTSLTSFCLPASLGTLGTGAFAGCRFASVTVAEGNSAYSVSDGNIYTDSGRTLVMYLQGDKTETSYETGTETAILEGAFANNTNLTSLVVGSGVTTIERGALGGIENLQTLTVPFLGDGAENQFLAYAFGAEAGFANGATSVYVPASLRSVTITGTVTALPAYAFYGCGNLTEIAGIDGVTSYGDYAFAYTGLTEFEIPAGVSEIGVNVFAGCVSLPEFSVAADNGAYAAFDGCLYDKALKVLISVPVSKTKVTFPDSVEEIASEAFRNSRVESVEIPESMQTIGYAAFAGCTELSYMRVPFIGGSRTENTVFLHIFGGGYEIVRDEEGQNTYSFFGTDSYPLGLTTVEYYGTEDLPDFAFTYCTALETVIYPDSVRAIGNYAFASTALKTFSLGPGVTSIGNYAFSYLSSLEGEVVIPGRITSLGTGAFAGDLGITSLTVEEGVTSIPSAFMRGYSETSGDTLYHFSALTSINLPASVTSIGQLAFDYAGYTYDSSTGEHVAHEVTVRIAEGSRLSVVGAGAFAGSCVRQIALPASVTAVGAQAFFDCPVLESVEIGNEEEGSALTSIYGLAFAFCPKLSSLRIYKSVTFVSDVPVLERMAMEEGGETLNCFFGSSVPAIGVYGASVYKTRANWSEYADSIYELE